MILINYNTEGVFDLNTKTNQLNCDLPTVTELREQLVYGSANGARVCIASIFDENTFVELGAYTMRYSSDVSLISKNDNSPKNNFEGVITGYGAIDGRLVYAFVQDSDRMGGVIDERHAKKICDLYKLAMANGAPVIGVFDSKGTDVFEGTTALSAYGRIISAVNKASGVIPQIAFVKGTCIGTCAAIAAMFDFVVKENDAKLYVTSDNLTGLKDAQSILVSYTDAEAYCYGYIRNLISFLPDNSSVGVQAGQTADNLNRMLGDVSFGNDGVTAIATIADNSMDVEVSPALAPEVSCAFATLGGVRCGIVSSTFAKNEGRLTPMSARKISRFVAFCDAFSIPVVTLVDSLGVAVDKASEEGFATELAKLATAYAGSTCPKVTVILGHAVGASFVLLGSKALGADVVYSLDSAEIGALKADSAVAFAWGSRITEDVSREQLVKEWRELVSSPLMAATSGEIDDIINVNELRVRIASALLMLCSKGTAEISARRKVLPL